MFGDGFKSDWKQFGRKLHFKPFLANKAWTNPWDFGQNFKFAQTSCIGKRSQEMMFGMVLRVIGNNLEESWF